MRKELLNHRPTSALRGQSPLCESVGTGHTSTHPSIFTKILLVLLITLLLPSAAWADYSYGGEALTFYRFNDSNCYYHNGNQNKWYVTTDGGYNNGLYSGFQSLKLTYERPLAGTLSDTYDYSAAVVLAGNVSDDNVVNIKVYRLATQNSASGTLIGSIHYIQNPDSNPTTYSYSYTPEKDNEENVVSQEFNNEFIQLAFEHQDGNDVESTLSTDAITSITLNFSGTSYGLRIGNYRVTDANANDIMGDGTASYDNGVLTLNGAEIGGCIYTSNALTIDLKGTNYIYATDSCAIKNTNSTGAVDLTFKSTDGTGNLTMWGNYSCTEGFSNPSYNGIKGLAGLKRTFIAPQILSGGDGTSGSPFEIATKEKFIEFANYVNDGYTSSNQYFKLTSDIEFSTTDKFEPIGNGTYKFSGTFNGNDKTINNLTLNGQGLFTTIEGGSVTKLTLSNYNLTGVAGSYVTGGITGELKDGGSITYCKIIDSSIACPSNEYNPDVAGIVSRQESGTTISNCIVDNTTIKAISSINESGPEQHAGGIVARTYDGATISSCQVINGTEIQNYNENMDVSCLYAGAIVGNNAGTLSSNTYDYSVQVKTKGLYESEVREKTLKEYTHRGSDAETDPSGISLYTQLVALPKSVTGGTITGADGTYYKSTDEGIYVVPGKTATLNATPTADTSFEIIWLQAVNATTTDVITPDSTSIDGGGRKYEFEMPDAQVNVTAKFAIDLAAEGITATIANATCTGEAIEPTTIAVEGIANVASLTKDTDFTITGYTKGGEAVTSPIDVGTYTVSIKGKGDYTGTKDVSYTIEKGIAGLYFYHIKGDQEDPVLAVEEATYGTAYDSPRLKNPHNLPITFSCKAENSETGAESDVATIDDDGNVTILKAGTVYVYAVAAENDNYDELDVHYQLNIDKADFSDVTIANIADQTYTGSAITPELTVTTPDGTSVTTDDYGIGYTPDNTNVGEVTITLTAKEGSEKFTESTTTTFNIIPPTPTIAFDNTKTYLNTDKIAISIDEAYATSSATAGITNTIYYSWDENPVTGTEYSEGRVAAQTGTLTAWVSATKSGATYESEKTTQAFTVKKDIASCTVTLPENATYTGAAFVPVVETPNGTTATTLTEGTDYTVSYEKVTGETATDVESMIDAGTYKITITGKGNYGGTKEITDFQIAQASLGDAAISKLIVGDKEYEYDPDKDIEIPYTGEAIQPEVVVVFNDGTVTVDASEYTVSYGENNTEVSNETAIASVTVTSTNKNFTGGTSTSLEFKIVPAPVTITAEEEQTVTYNAQQQAYTGASADNENVTLAIAYYPSEEERTTGSNALAGAPTDAGTYYVSVTLNEESQQHYTAKPANVTFTIEQLNISEAVITLDNEELTYNGEEQSVKVTKVMAGDIEVAADYYELNGNRSGTEAGNYKLIVTAKLNNSDGSDFKNNFKGNAEKAWKINHRTIPADVIAEKFTSEGQTYATFYDASESFLAPQGIVAYIITGVSGNSVTVKAVSYIKAGIPVLLQKTSTSTETEETTDDIFATNILKYAEGNLTANGGQYVLYKNEFVKATGSITSGKCYLEPTGTFFAGTRGFSIAGGAEGTTAISDAVVDSDHSEWFDLQGRKIEKPSKKGLYIRDGKKIVVK